MRSMSKCCRPSQAYSKKEPKSERKVVSVMNLKLVIPDRMARAVQACMVQLMVQNPEHAEKINTAVAIRVLIRRGLRTLGIDMDSEEFDAPVIEDDIEAVEGEEGEDE